MLMTQLMPVPETVDELVKHQDLLLVRGLMDTVYKGYRFTPHMLGNGLICRKHKFFDNLMGDVPLCLNNVNGLTLDI